MEKIYTNMINEIVKICVGRSSVTGENVGDIFKKEGWHPRLDVLRNEFYKYKEAYFDDLDRCFESIDKDSKALHDLNECRRDDIWWSKLLLLRPSDYFLDLVSLRAGMREYLFDKAAK